MKKFTVLITALLLCCVSLLSLSLNAQSQSSPDFDKMWASHIVALTNYDAVYNALTNEEKQAFLSNRMSEETPVMKAGREVLKSTNEIKTNFTLSQVIAGITKYYGGACEANCGLVYGVCAFGCSNIQGLGWEVCINNCEIQRTGCLVGCAAKPVIPIR